MLHVQFVRRRPACELAAKIENQVSKITHRASPTFTARTPNSDLCRVLRLPGFGTAREAKSNGTL
jgi:hypothetical protein